MNNILVVGIVALIIGAGAGYTLAPKPLPTEEHIGHEMSMADTMANMSAMLEGKAGADFDRAFLDEMIVHHEGAVVMAEQVLHHADKAELKTFAKAIIDVQTQEIEQMKSWRAEWFSTQ